MTALPATMSAISIVQPGGPDVLVPESRPVPRPGSGEVLIKVAAAGVNRPDVIQRTGGYPPPPGAPDIPGLETAGTIVATGDGVPSEMMGTDVCALVSGGGYAEYCTAHHGHALPVPAGFSIGEAAAIPENYFTVWHNVFERGALKSGETILIHGGSSGIGNCAIQLAKAFGATVITTAGTDEKCERVRALGADIAVNYQKVNYVDAVKEATGGRGAALILDMVGGDYIERNFDAASPDGRIVQIAFLNGPVTEVNFTKLMIKRLTHTGSTLRPRDTAFKTRLAGEVRKHVWPLFESGSVRPVMDSEFALADAAKAHARMETSKHIGKILLIP